MNDKKRKMKRITIVYLPETELPNDVFESDVKAGYTVHESKSNVAIGYKIWAGSLTVIVPKDIVHRIEAEL